MSLRIIDVKIYRKQQKDCIYKKEKKGKKTSKIQKKVKQTIDGKKKGFKYLIQA